jgi:molecular chaperone Hsp33
MDRIVRWIDGKDELRASLVEAGNLEKFLRELHEIPPQEEQSFFQTVLGTLLFAQDLKTHQTLSLQVEHAGRAWHCDATLEGMTRAMTTGSKWLEPGFRISVRRLGQKGLIYQSVVESKENSVLLALREYLEVSEQSPAHLSCYIDSSTLRAEAFLLRGFPDTPVETLSKALVATDALDPSTPIRELLTAANPGRWDILNETTVEHHCPCTRLRAMASLATLGAAELEEAAAKDGELEVICDFCRTRYVYNASELLNIAQLLNTETPE